MLLSYKIQILYSICYLFKFVTLVVKEDRNEKNQFIQFIYLRLKIIYYDITR